MNNFSIKLSRRLREIGVEGKSEKYWRYTRTRWGTLGDPWLDSDEYEYGIDDDHTSETVPAYTLHDILSLLPKIAEKKGLDAEVMLENIVQLPWNYEQAEKSLMLYLDL